MGTGLIEAARHLDDAPWRVGVVGQTLGVGPAARRLQVGRVAVWHLLHGRVGQDRGVERPTIVTTLTAPSMRPGPRATEPLRSSTPRQRASRG